MQTNDNRKLFDIVDKNFKILSHVNKEQLPLKVEVTNNPMKIYTIHRDNYDHNSASCYLLRAGSPTFLEW